LIVGGGVGGLFGMAVGVAVGLTLGKLLSNSKAASFFSPYQTAQKVFKILIHCLPLTTLFR